MHRFYLAEPIEGSDIKLSEDIFHQTKNVLKFKTGEKFVLFDGSGYDFIVEYSGRANVSVSEKMLNRREPDRKVFLFQSILKKDKMEWIFEKATELGVHEFIPVLSARSIKKDFNEARAKKIIQGASEQSGRAACPNVRAVVNFKKALEIVQTERVAGVIADVNSKKHIAEGLKEPATALFVGPEGGWDSKEIDEAKESGFKAVSLGRLTLRAETAAIVSTAFLLS